MVTFQLWIKFLVEMKNYQNNRHWAFKMLRKCLLV